MIGGIDFECWLLDEFESDWEGEDLFSDECVDFLIPRLEPYGFDETSCGLVVNLVKHLYATGKETYDLSAVIKVAVLLV